MPISLVVSKNLLNMLSRQNTTTEAKGPPSDLKYFETNRKNLNTEICTKIIELYFAKGKILYMNLQFFLLRYFSEV